MPSEKLAARRAEFVENRWNHTEDAFQMQFDRPEPLSDVEVAALTQVIEAIDRGATDAELSSLVRRLVTKNACDLMATFLQIVGSTRNKIVTDLKAMTSASKLKIPSKHSLLAADDRVWALAGPYLAARLRAVLGPLSGDPVEGALEALNNATYPGWIRQERAKRQGHEAERRLASLLLACGIAFEPKEKASNPMCADAQINGVSFDIVVPNVRSPRVCVKSTVHTANIGQYGESKDHLEVDEAVAMIKASSFKPKPVLLVLIDGIGFNSNRDGLDGVLEKSDEFCQFKTIWKAVVIAASCVGAKLRLELAPEAKLAHKEFLARWDYSKNVVSPGTLDPSKSIEAGDARLESTVATPKIT